MPDESHTTSSEDPPSAYVDTPYGMMTAAGRWYHIPEDDLRDYAGTVLDHVSLDRLLQWADVWMDSPRTLTLWLLPLLLWGMPAGSAALCALGIYVGWALASPALVSLWAVRGASALSYVLVQGLYYVGTLSAIAAAEKYGAVGVGLAGFVLFRWGLVQWAFRAGVRRLQKMIYPLPVTDQVLRGLIIRVALKHRLSVSHVDAMTKDILENWGARSKEGTEASQSDSTNQG